MLVADVIKATAAAGGVSIETLLAAKSDTKRGRVLVQLRQLGMLVAVRATKASYPAIAARFGRRDHTTIVHGERVAWDRVLQRDAVTWDDLTEILTALDLPHLPNARPAAAPIPRRNPVLLERDIRVVEERLVRMRAQLAVLKGEAA